MQTPPPESANDPSDRPNRVPWPPLLYATVLCLAALLERYSPSLPAWPESFALRWLGAALFLTGLGIAVAGLLRFRADDTTVDPTGRATNLATEGIYALTRNPMYLGAVVGFVGLALALRSPWLMLLVAPMALALRQLAILPEEAYLERRFGAAYLAYKRRTRRWL
jgi:protein-S-isoprenylcysteine O-methyltransferase Ste14